MESMKSHLDTKHGISPSKHPITFFGKPPSEPHHPWPAFKKPVETWFALVAPVSGDPETISALTRTSKVPSTSSGSVLSTAWNTAVMNAAAKREQEDESAEDDRYEFLDEDLRITDTMISHAEISPVHGNGKQPIMSMEGNILLATNAKPVPFSIEEGAWDGDLEGPSGVGDISGAEHAPFYAQLRTTPKNRTWLSVGYPYKTGMPVIPLDPPPVRGNFLEQRKELLAGSAAAGKGQDSQMTS